jgi:Outer membrane receptor for ferrienterochelin and colicins
MLLNKNKLSAAVAIAASLIASNSYSQEQELEELLVTGFRSSILKAQEVKRDAVGSVDAIMAEDIADFPDQNLAESLQRIPGVTITREAGEGREISVRGLSPNFSRTTLNGMQVQSISASGGNLSSGRSFDFSIFASELFQQLAVHKTTSAELDEGSLGATVAMQTGRPLDMDEDVVAFNVQGSFNDLSSELTPRASGLFSVKNDEGTLGALFSVAYSERNVRTEGAQTGRWEDDNFVTFQADDPDAEPPVGDNDPTNDPVILDNCVQCNPDGTFTVRGDFDAAQVAAVNGALHPRFPRVAEKTHDNTRTGVTSTLQWAPTESTTATFDFMYANVVGQRLEPFSQAISLARTGDTGMKQTTLEDYTLDANGNMVAATMNNVDVRSEYFESNWESDFSQFSLLIEHEFSDTFSMDVLLGTSDSSLSDQQITVAYEHFSANDERKRIDYADNDAQLIYDMGQDDLGVEYNWDLTNPLNWEKSEFRNRLSTAETGSSTARVDF